MERFDHLSSNLYIFQPNYFHENYPVIQFFFLNISLFCGLHSKNEIDWYLPFWSDELVSNEEKSNSSAWKFCRNLVVSKCMDWCCYEYSCVLSDFISKQTYVSIFYIHDSSALDEFNFDDVIKRIWWKTLGGIDHRE